ncbi:MAG: hypothetical protein I3273_01035 [Candidatus Moeniiplasma glomeromycotorum]|nr:hypothetical protein [Candidatus Moeniiplasma glomeromycotorum]MCE8167294.1 hypothetical protein [Candidatus Moeniiplasma glomeromycotorum]MCE8168693.1 hypothetical protein [Candidatus Moeniiplasma glomeromycotorum]
MPNQKEQRWEYEAKITFRNQEIVKITITDHYQEKHSEITHELILGIVNLLNGKRLEPRKKHGNRDIYVWDRIVYNQKKYRLIFWFKDNETNHLWIRNCYPVN